MYEQDGQSTSVGRTNRTKWIGRLLLAGAAGAFGFCGFLAYAWESAITPVDRPDPASFSPAMVERGRILAAAGDCAACHSAPGRPAYSGGLGLPTPFGVLYSTNITPDPKHGIGRWSRKAFRRAMHEGVGRDGSHLYPAFPYTAYKNVTVTDTDAIYAYLMTRKPVALEPPENGIVFPFNFRFFQAGWKMLFFDKTPMAADRSRSAEWNRGAYLAEGLGHCSACHSPRNLLGAEKQGADKYGGAVVEGWFAPALNGRTGSPLPWTKDELYSYLRFGATANHGVAAGPMGPVVSEGLAPQSEADVRALATYLADIGQAPSGTTADQIASARRTRGVGALSDAARRGKTAFEAGCIACHYNPPGRPLNALRPDMAVNTAATGPDPSTLIQAILKGVSRKNGHREVFMPGYAGALSDESIADIAAYLHETYGTPIGRQSKAWRDLVGTTRTLRHENEEQRAREKEASR